MSKLAHCSREDLEALIARHVASGAIASSEVEALVAAAEPEAIRGQASEGSSLLDQLGPDLFVQVTSWLDSGALARLDQVCRRLHYSGSAEGPSVNDALRFAAERVHPEADNVSLVTDTLWTYANKRKMFYDGRTGPWPEQTRRPTTD